MATDAELGDMSARREHQGLPTTLGNWERPGKVIPCETWDTLTPDFWPLDCETLHSCCLSPLRLQGVDTDPSSRILSRIAHEPRSGSRVTPSLVPARAGTCPAISGVEPLRGSPGLPPAASRGGVNLVTWALKVGHAAVRGARGPASLSWAARGSLPSACRSELRPRVETQVRAQGGLPSPSCHPGAGPPSSLQGVTVSLTSQPPQPRACALSALILGGSVSWPGLPLPGQY